MKLRIKKLLFTWYVLDKNNIVVAKIKSKKIFTPSKNILNSDDNIIFTTNIVNTPSSKDDWNYASSRKYVVYEKDQPIATATFSYAKSSSKNKIQSLFLIPPQIDEMNIETPFGPWHIKRQKDNSILINNDKITLGTVTSFFSFKRKEIECLDGYDPAFLAGIYMLIEYMMHEDDLIVV